MSGVTEFYFLRFMKALSELIINDALSYFNTIKLLALTSIRTPERV